MAVGCETANRSSTPAMESKLETITAQVIEIQPTTWPTIIRSQGNLLSDEQSVVGSKIAGRIAIVHVDLGDTVRQGDAIVTLEQEDLRLFVEQAEAQLEQARSAVGLSKSASLSSLSPENAPPVRQERAVWDETKRNLKRASNLLKENAISSSEYDQIAAAERVAEARYAAALNGVREKIALISVRAAELSLAKQQLTEATIVSPLDGFIARRDVAPGTFLSIGQSVAVVVRTNPLRFRGSVPERYAQNLSEGQAVKLTIESITEPRKTKISRISPLLDQQSRSLAFEAEVENGSEPTLRTGLFAEAEIIIDPQATAIVVPNSAIIEFAGAQKVWKVVDNQATEHEIFCGMTRGDYREVLTGLQPGDVILADASKGRVAKVVPQANVNTPTPDTVNL